MANTADGAIFTKKRGRFSATSYYVFSKLAFWRGSCAHFHVLGISSGWDYHAQTPSFCNENAKTDLTEPNVPVDHMSRKSGPNFLTENLALNGLKSDG